MKVDARSRHNGELRVSGAGLFGMLGPASLVLLVTTLTPFVVLIGISLLQMDLSVPGSESTFVGLGHYRRLFQDARFLDAVVLSGRFTLVGLLIEGPIGVLLGFYLAGLGQRMQRYVSAVVIIPMLMPAVMVGLTWLFMLQPDYGLVSVVLRNIFGFGEPLLASPRFAMTVVRLVDVWEWTPFVALVTLAGLQSIPLSVRNAADVDGLTIVQRMKHVYWPSVSRVVLLALVLRAIDAVKVFDVVYLLTGGGPGASTELASLYVQRVAVKETQFGYGAAATVVLTYAILGLTKVFYNIARRREAAA